MNNTELLQEIAKEQSEIKEEIVKQSVLFQSHIEQDREMYEELRKMQETQQGMSVQLAVYNKQLEIHIAGVQELKNMNALILQQIQLHKKEVELRLQIAEAPVRWLDFTVKISKWVAAFSILGGAIFSLYKFLK